MAVVQTEFKLKDFTVFTLPITLQVLLRNVVGMTDNFMVGVLGPDYMAALRISTSYFFFFIVLLFAFSNAGSIIAGQLWGKNNRSEYYKVCAATVFISSIIAVILGLILFIFSRQAISLIIDDAAIIRYGSDYLKITGFSFIGMGISIALSVLFTAQGNTRVPFYQQIITTVLNVVLNYIFIFGKFGFPAMGVAGAALSTLIATIAGLVYLIYEAKRSHNLPVLIDIINPDKKHIFEILRIGLPVLGDMFFWQFAMMVYLKFIGMAGKDDVAVYGIIGLFFSVLFLSVSGFVTGTGIVVSQLIGAGLYSKAKTFGYKALWFAMITGGLAGLLLIAFSGFIPALFKLDASVYTSAVICLIILGLRQPFATANGVLASAIRAGKDTRFPLYTSFGAFFCIGLPLTFVAGPVMNKGIILIFTAMTIEEVSKAFIFFIRYTTGKWIISSSENTILQDNEEFIKSGIVTDTIQE